MRDRLKNTENTLTDVDNLFYNTPMHKYPPEYWIEAAELLRQSTPQIIKVREAQQKLGYASTSAVDYALKEMLKLGLVERIETGEFKGEWRLP